MIAQKKQEVTIQSDDLYEIFNQATMKAVDGTDVEVLQSLGFFSLRELNQQKDYLTAQLLGINEKITLIENITI